MAPERRERRDYRPAGVVDDGVVCRYSSSNNPRSGEIVISALAEASSRSCLKCAELSTLLDSPEVDALVRDIEAARVFPQGQRAVATMGDMRVTDQREWVRADQVRVGDRVFIPGAADVTFPGSSRQHFVPNMPPRADAIPSRIVSVEAPGSFTLEPFHVCSYGRATPVMRVRNDRRPL